MSRRLQGRLRRAFCTLRGDRVATVCDVWSVNAQLIQPPGTPTKTDSSRRRQVTTEPENRSPGVFTYHNDWARTGQNLSETRPDACHGDTGIISGASRRTSRRRSGLRSAALRARRRHQQRNLSTSSLSRPSTIRSTPSTRTSTSTPRTGRRRSGSSTSCRKEPRQRRTQTT